ncbi:DUF1641 domain-containing protein [Candidatus Bipolaricaulota bacterium]|nr:DUF1641 domain-containing protein [Candidatus Bipolaricaulota bacterium]
MSNSQSGDTTTVEVNEELKQAIEENPEAVAGFVQRLDLVNQLLDIADLGISAMDDEMVTTLVGMATRLGELVDTAADPATVESLDDLLGATREASNPENLPESTGALSLMGQLNDPEVRRGISFLLVLAKYLGKSIEE